MTIDTQACIDRLVSHMATTGRFDSVNGHEPKNPPTGVTAAVWVQRIAPTTAITAANATSALLVFTIRLYANMLQEPQDAIDPALVAATDAILTLVSGDFTLGDEVDYVDLLGTTGTSLSAQAGYVTIDKTMYRAMDVTVPVVIIDAWPQAR